MVIKTALLGLVIAIAGLWFWNWNMCQILKEHKKLIRELQTRPIIKQPRDEDRCHFCQEQATCIAFDTGVIYPCPYFKKEEKI